MLSILACHIKNVLSCQTQLQNYSTSVVIILCIYGPHRLAYRYEIWRWLWKLAVVMKIGIVIEMRT